MLTEGGEKCGQMSGRTDWEIGSAGAGRVRPESGALWVRKEKKETRSPNMINKLSNRAAGENNWCDDVMMEENMAATRSATGE